MARALAVLPVILFHANFEIVSGGFALLMSNDEWHLTKKEQLKVQRIQDVCLNIKVKLNLINFPNY